MHSIKSAGYNLQFQTCSGAHPTSYKVAITVLSQESINQGVKLNTHLI